jgi:hypothetical protein
MVPRSQRWTPLKCTILTVILSALLVGTFTRQALAGEVAIDFFDQESLRLAPQEDMVACWAASMSAALKCKGVDLPQSSIKIALNGNPEAATLQDPLKLSRLLDLLPYKEGKLKTLSATLPAQWISWPKFKQEIEAGNPFVVGYWTGPGSAHVVVVYGAITNGYGLPIAYKIWDPLPGVGPRIAPLLTLNQTAWFFFILRSAELE